MSESNILIKMTVAKARMIEELITKFLGHKPDWNERKAFRILNSLGESSIYLKGEFIGTVRYATEEEEFI